MKRHITLLLLLLLSFGASAQIITTEKKEMRTICVQRVGNVIVQVQEGTYVVGIQSSNQYDFPFLFVLGNNRESAIQTLHDFLPMIKSIKKGETITFTTPSRSKVETYTIMKWNGKDRIAFLNTGTAGNVFLSFKEAEKILQAVLYDIQQ